jgi:hypothetical protein
MFIGLVILCVVYLDPLSIVNCYSPTFFTYNYNIGSARKR